MTGLNQAVGRTCAASDFDLVGYARQHRYRLRNLHDGNPVPPARRRKAQPATLGYVGPSERCDAIVGLDGYVSMDGDRLSVCLFYKSAEGVNQAMDRLETIGASIDQVGDTEASATVPLGQIEEVLRLIRVSRLRPGDATRFTAHPEAALAPESLERPQIGSELRMNKGGRLAHD